MGLSDRSRWSQSNVRRVVFLLGLALAPGWTHRQITPGCVKEAIRPLCPRLVGKWPFNATKFSGKWNLYAGGPRTLMMGVCGRYVVNYEGCAMNGTRYAYTYTAFDPNTGEEIQADGAAWPLYGEEVGMVYGVYRKTLEYDYSPVYEAAIISTDYKTHALFMACRPMWDPEGYRFRREMFSEVWVRPGVSLTEEIFYTLTNFFSSYDLNPRLIQTVPRKHCSASDKKEARARALQRALTPHPRRHTSTNTTAGDTLSLLNAP